MTYSQSSEVKEMEKNTQRFPKYFSLFLLKTATLLFHYETAKLIALCCRASLALRALVSDVLCALHAPVPCA